MTYLIFPLEPSPKELWYSQFLRFHLLQTPNREHYISHFGNGSVSCYLVWSKWDKLRSVYAVEGAYHSVGFCTFVWFESQAFDIADYTAVNYERSEVLTS